MPATAMDTSSDKAIKQAEHEAQLAAARVEKLANKAAKKAANKAAMEEARAAKAAKKAAKKAAYEKDQAEKRAAKEAKIAAHKIQVEAKRKEAVKARSESQTREVSVTFSTAHINALVKQEMEKYGAIENFKQGQKMNSFVARFETVKDAKKAANKEFTFEIPVATAPGKVDFTSLCVELPEGVKFADAHSELLKVFGKHGKVRCITWFRATVVVSYESVSSVKKALKSTQKLGGVVLETTAEMPTRNKSKKRNAAPTAPATNGKKSKKSK